jgi:hypothetical protein
MITAVAVLIEDRRQYGEDINVTIVSVKLTQTVVTEIEFDHLKSV